MKRCGHLEDYLNGELAGRSAVAFEEHAESCGHCRARVTEWNELKSQMRSWAAHKTIEAPSAAEAARLAVDLRLKGARTDVRPKSRAVFVWGGVATVAALFVAFLMVTLAFPEDERVRSPQLKGQPQSTERPVVVRLLYSAAQEAVPEDRVSGEAFSVSARGRMLFGIEADRIGLEALSEMAIVKASSEETVVELRRGSLAAEVAPRGGKRPFRVEVAEYVVEVVGTRFKVSLDGYDGFEVAVDEGVVIVSGSQNVVHEVREGEVLTFNPGERWKFSALSPQGREDLEELLKVPESDTAGVSLESAGEDEQELDVSPVVEERKRPKRSEFDPQKVRALIVKGRYQPAESALLAHLADAPRDVRSWSLLADCRRKAGKWKQAVMALERVMALGSDEMAGAARFEAAVIIDDKLGNCERAARLYGRYVESSSLLKAEAMVRLANCRMKQGRVEEAEKILRRVVNEHSGTVAAVRARRLLESVKRTDDPHAVE